MSMCGYGKLHNNFYGVAGEDTEGEERAAGRTAAEEEHQDPADRQDAGGVRPAEEAGQDEEGHPAVQDRELAQDRQLQQEEAAHLLAQDHAHRQDRGAAQRDRHLLAEQPARARLQGGLHPDARQEPRRGQQPVPDRPPQPPHPHRHPLRRPELAHPRPHGGVQARRLHPRARVRHRARGDGADPPRPPQGAQRHDRDRQGGGPPQGRGDQDRGAGLPRGDQEQEPGGPAAHEVQPGGQADQALHRARADAPEVLLRHRQEDRGAQQELRGQQEHDPQDRRTRPQDRPQALQDRPPQAQDPAAQEGERRAQQRPQEGEGQHLQELPGAQGEDEPLQGRGGPQAQGTHQQLPQRCRKTQGEPRAGRTHPQDCGAVQTAGDREGEGAAVLREHGGRVLDLRGDEEPVPGADGGGVRVVQVPEQLLQAAQQGAAGPAGHRAPEGHAQQGQPDAQVAAQAVPRRHLAQRRGPPHAQPALHRQQPHQHHAGARRGPPRPHRHRRQRGARLQPQPARQDGPAALPVTDPIIIQLMNNRMMLPIELTKILYDRFEGEISTSSQDSEIYGKCLNGPGKVVFKNGNRYEGDFYNGLLNGSGKFIWANGIVYEGQFTDNRITGRGTYRWPDGSSYEGEVKDGLRHGSGKYTIDDATYEGEWLEGKKHGSGKIVFKSGSIFEGSFRNDMKDGYGKMYYYPSGNFFEGEWREDVKAGMGTMNWSDIREKYVGNWRDNQQEGWGIHIWLESKGEGKYLRNRYEGNWKKGVRDGFGVFYYANGSKYEGYWRDNMKEGYAFYTDENGKNSLILFSKDRMIKSDKPAQLDNENAKKLPNKKEVEPNYYSLCLSIDHFYYPLTPNLELMYNFLLRNNTQLKAWYKAAAAFYDQQSEFSFCLTLEGAWKMIRSLKILGDFSLAHFNRGLPHANPDIQALLKIVPQAAEERVSYEDVYYRFLGAEAARQSDLAGLAEAKQVAQEFPFKEYLVHDREANILFRQFVHLLVWMAHHLEPNFERPQKAIEKLMAKIAPFLESISKTIKPAGNENMSENKSSISKAEKSLTPFYRSANTDVFKALLAAPQASKHAHRDETVRMRRLLGLGLVNGCIGEAEWALLEKILEKYFDNDVLARERSELFANSRLPAKILNVLNYELIEYEFIEVVYILFIKKLASTKENDENKKKYQETLEDLFASSRTHQHRANEEREFRQETRYIHSAKQLKRQELEGRRRVMEERKAKAEAAAREREQEQRELEWMQREDLDIKDVEFEEEASDFQI